jgi:hypothetical protein
VDPAEEVLLDPMLVNPFFNRVEIELFLCQLPVWSAQRRRCEYLRDKCLQRDDTGSKALTRRMRENYS